MVEVVNRSLAANTDEPFADGMVAVAANRLRQPVAIQFNHYPAPGFAVAADRTSRAAAIEQAGCGQQSPGLPSRKRTH